MTKTVVPILIGGGYMLGFIRKHMGSVDVSEQGGNEGLKTLAGSIEQYHALINVILRNYADEMKRKNEDLRLAIQTLEESLQVIEQQKRLLIKNNII